MDRFWCVDGLNRLTTDAWLGDFSKTFSCTRLTLDLVAQQKPLAFSTPFADALVEHVALLAAGQQTPPEDIRTQWPELLDCLSEVGTRKIFRERVLRVATSTDGKLDVVFFVLYGKEISDPDTLHANDEVVSQLLSPIVRQRNVAGLGWMRDVLSNDSAFLFNASAEHAVEELETRIRHCISEPNDDEAQTTIAEIASLLGIEALRTESASEDDVPADEEST